MELRPYQEKLIHDVRSAMLAGKRAPLVVAPCGSGKTVMFSAFTKRAVNNGKRVMILAHREELLDQISDTLSKFKVRHEFISAGRPMVPEIPVQVAGVFSAVRRLSRIKAPDLIICDECFPGHTMVDNKRIDSIKIGDSVRTNDGFGKVENIFRRATNCVLDITFASGNKLTCTPNHPIATPEGFIPANNLTIGGMVYTIIDYEMYNLRETSESEIMRQSGMQIGMLAENYFELIQKAWGRNNEVQENKWNVSSRNKSKSFHKVTGYGLEANSSRRERKSSNDSRISTGIGFGVEMQCSGSYGNELLLSNSLQDRCWEHRFEDRDRGGRKLAQCAVKEDSRQKENGIFGIDRVENIEVHQQGNSPEFERLCPQGIVYNLHIEPNNTYFANNILVHNCHHVSPGSSWGKIFDHFPKAWRIGVTATPQRLSGEPLGYAFDHMILGPTASELISAGHLSKYKLYSPSTISTEGMHMVAGDFKQDELSIASDKPSITGDAIEHYTRLAHGKRAVAFCVSLEHARHVRDQFNSAGIKAEVIDGTMDKMDRRILVNLFREGRTLVLVSVNVVSEGFDLPAIECAIMLRPTASLALWIQQSMRALRTFPGKEYAIILDHAGNWDRHGRPDDTHEWSLEGSARRKKSEQPKVSGRICPDCFGCMPSTKDICSYCGHVFTPQGREIEHKEGELVEVDPAAMRRNRLSEQSKAKTFEELVEIGKKRGYKNAYSWARILMQVRRKRGKA